MVKLISNSLIQSHSFSRFYTLIFILFLALINFDNRITTYMSVHYKAELRNALHILLHNSKPRNNQDYLDSNVPLPYPIFQPARLL